MPKILIALLLSFFVSTALAGDDTRVFSAATSGELAVDTEGRVVELTLERKQLGDEVMAAVEQRVRAWRFEPVVEDGRAVPFRARVWLDMLAFREPGADGLALAIRRVRFTDLPAAEQVPANASSGEFQRMSQPVYPMTPARLGIGGSLWLVARVGADGRVVDVATEAAELRTERADGPARQQGHAREFARAAERAARDWHLPGLAGQTVTVPVKFRTGNDRGERWMRIHNVPLEVPAWVAVERAGVVQLSESGEQGSHRVQLLSAVN